MEAIARSVAESLLRDAFERTKLMIFDETTKRFPQIAQITGIVKDMGSLKELLPKAKEALVEEVNKVIDFQMKKYNEDVGKVIDERIKAAVAGIPVAPAAQNGENTGEGEYANNAYANNASDPGAYENNSYANNYYANNAAAYENEDPSAAAENNSGWFSGGAKPTRRRRRGPRRGRKISRKGIKAMPAERKGTRRNRRRASRRSRRSTRRNMRK